MKYRRQNVNENKTCKEIWSFNSRELPDTQNDDMYELNSDESIFSTESKVITEKASAFSEKTLTIRYILFCAIFTALGILFSLLMRKNYPIANIQSTALLHFPDAEISQYVFGFRIFFSKLPTVMLLMLAGFTYFSGALTVLLISLNSVAAGVGISTVLLYSAELENVGISMTDAVVYVAWTLLALAITVFLAITSRHTASKLHRKEFEKSKDKRAFPLELSRKYACATVLYIALCIAYTMALTILS